MSSHQATCDALVQLFGRAVQDHEDCMTECLSLCRLYTLTPQDLFYKFEAFALSALPADARSNPSLTDFRALRQHLQSSTEATSNDPTSTQTPRRDAAIGWGSGSTGRKKVGLGGMGIGKLFGTPGSANGAISSSSTAFGTSNSTGQQRQTPSRPSEPRRGNALGTTGDDSMSFDDSPSRAGGGGGGGGGGGSGSASGSSRTSWTTHLTLNARVDPATRQESRSSTHSRVKLLAGRAPSSFPTRYMFERSAEKGEALDDHLEAMSTVLIEAYAIKEEDIQDPSLIHQESVYVVGRICPKLTPPTNANKKDGNHIPSGLPRLQPTPNGIMIESSKLQGAGQRVPIWLTEGCVVRRPPGAEEAETAMDVGAVDVLGLFPGMIVGLKGRNGGGSGFGVEEVLLLPGLSFSAAPPSDMLEAQYGPELLNGAPMEVVVASGPYTSDDDLDFAKWHALMDNIERDPVDVVVLLGPFLPLNHPLLLTSNHLPSEHFKRHFASRMNRICPTTTSRTNFILVPSVLDSLSSHAAWPQPPYDKAELGLARSIKTLPNPAIFSVAGIIFGTSTADVLRDLRSEELAMRVKRAPLSNGSGVRANSTSQGQGQGEDVLARAVRHVISQRNFYPLFPPPQPKLPPSSTSISHSISPSASTDPERGAEVQAPLPLSLPHLHLTTFTQLTPEVLILPSIASPSAATSIEPFARFIDSVVVLNPGSVAAGSRASQIGAGADVGSAVSGGRATATAAGGKQPEEDFTSSTTITTTTSWSKINAAKVTIRPMDRRYLERQVELGDEPIGSSLLDRCRVELMTL